MKNLHLLVDGANCGPDLMHSTLGRYALLGTPIPESCIENELQFAHGTICSSFFIRG